MLKQNLASVLLAGSLAISGLSGCATNRTYEYALVEKIMMDGAPKTREQKQLFHKSVEGRDLSTFSSGTRQRINTLKQTGRFEYKDAREKRILDAYGVGVKGKNDESELVRLGSVLDRMEYFENRFGW